MILCEDAPVRIKTSPRPPDPVKIISELRARLREEESPEDRERREIVPPVSGN
jgi:hypothetical protein